MSKYYIMNTGLQAQADSLKAVSKKLDALRSEMLAVACAVDVRDILLAGVISTLKDILSAGARNKNLQELCAGLYGAGQAFEQALEAYGSAENNSFKKFELVDIGALYSLVGLLMGGMGLGMTGDGGNWYFTGTERQPSHGLPLFIDPDSDQVIALRQPYSGPCIMYAITMLLRRMQAFSHQKPTISYEDVFKANGNTDYCYWKDELCGYSMQAERKGADPEARIKELLAANPEGVVAYFVGSGSHAVLITDYTDGVFYVSDPATGQGRQPLSESSIMSGRYGNPSNIWASINRFYYCSDPARPGPMPL